MTVHGRLQRVDRLRAAIAGSIDDFISLRRDLHRHPELAFAEARTSDIVARHLSSWGYDVARGIGGTGVVATLTRGTGNRAIGIRADMDALPITEDTGLDHASGNAGVMHACGHDGHTAILLCAAKHIAEQARFDGTLRLVFQPAEETGAGAMLMLADGLFERFPVDAIFGLHNLPGMPLGQWGFIAGAAMASSDSGVIRMVGRGGHGAYPDQAIDPVLAAASFITAVQGVVSRNVSPLDPAVVSIGSIHGGTAGSIIPHEVEMRFTLRAFDEGVRRLLNRRIREVAEAQASSCGAEAEVTVTHGVAVTSNDPEQTEIARRVAVETFGEAQVVTLKPFTGGEDFSYLLERRAGSFVHVGMGEGPPLHSSLYDFNDATIAPAALFWIRLVEEHLANPVPA